MSVMLTHIVQEVELLGDEYVTVTFPDANVHLCAFEVLLQSDGFVEIREGGWPLASGDISQFVTDLKKKSTLRTENQT